MKEKLLKEYLDSINCYQCCDHRKAIEKKTNILIDTILREDRARVKEEIGKIYSISDVEQDSCDNYKQKVLNLIDN